VGGTGSGCLMGRWVPVHMYESPAECMYVCVCEILSMPIACVLGLNGSAGRVRDGYNLQRFDFCRIYHKISRGLSSRESIWEEGMKFLFSLSPPPDA
jgi:hypothetical protein